MNCPHCGQENIAGADVCEQCGQSLEFLSQREPMTAVERNLVKQPLATLNPSRPIIVSPQDSVADVLKLMVDKHIGCVLICDGDDLVGIFSERDALLKLNVDTPNLQSEPISQYMSSSPETLDWDDKIAFALHKMDLGGFRHIPLTKEGRIAGIVSIRDILRFITADLVAAEAS